MDVSDWPMDQETWKEEYLNYQNEYRSIIDKKYNKHVSMPGFMDNNIKLNNLLLNLKKNPTPKKINRLKVRVNEFYTKLNDIELLQNNPADPDIDPMYDDVEEYFSPAQYLANLVEAKDVLVSPALLEASEQFLLENEAIETLNKHKFGEKALENLYRPGGPMFKKGEESYYNNELQNVTKKKGGKRKKTKKKRGDKLTKGNRKKTKKKRGGKLTKGKRKKTKIN